jgi:NADPH:quinone reductase
MRAWRVHSLGDPAEVMSLDEVDQPTPGDGQVLVKVLAAGLNFPDVLMAQGKYQERPPLPFTPGFELCGEVVGTGQRVLGAPAGGPGAFAEYALMDAAAAWPVPDEMSDAQAASLYLTYQTGYVGLHRRAALQAGEWLLVHAGAGGVGTAAIQLGKAAGAKVIATAGGPRKTQVCTDLGADHVIDYTAEDFVPIVKELTGGRGADVVYDPVGGPYSEPALRATAWAGRFLVVGFAAGDIPAIPLNLTLLRGCDVVGVFWGAFVGRDPERHRQNVEELIGWWRDGKLRPHVSSTYPLERAAEAIRELADRQAKGKVVVTIGDD